jgi:hypothetical protein
MLHASTYVIGDSHTLAFDGMQDCHICYLGPILMHRVGRDSLRAVNLEKLGVTDESTVVYVFGEIDVRCHIGKQRDEHNRNIDEIITTLATSYINTILENQSHYNKLQSVIYNIVPPFKNCISHSKYTVYGTTEDRISLTKMVNNTLKKLCDQHGIHFLDIYDNYAAEDGTLRIELSDGNVHIKAEHNAHIQQKLRELLSKKIY